MKKLKILANPYEYHPAIMLDVIRKELKKITNKVVVTLDDPDMFDYSIPPQTNPVELKLPVLANIQKIAKKYKYIFELYVENRGTVTFRFVADY